MTTASTNEQETRAVRPAAHDRYEAEPHDALRQARRDLDAGRYTTDLKSFRKSVLAKRGIG